MKGVAKFRARLARQTKTARDLVPGRNQASPPSSTPTRLADGFGEKEYAYASLRFTPGNWFPRSAQPRIRRGAIQLHPPYACGIATSRAVGGLGVVVQRKCQWVSGQRFCQWRVNRDGLGRWKKATDSP